MSVPFTQLVSTTFDDVVNERNQAQDQWSESAFLRYLERKGGVKKTKGGATLKMGLDYQINSGNDFLATDSTAVSTSKTSVITEAQYTYAQLVVPATWSHYDEALNAGGNDKLDLVTAIVRNAISSHDQAVETGMFASSATDGFESLVTLLTEDGTGTIGGIVAGTETWWKNQFLDATASTLVADMTTIYNSCAKGSGGSYPNVIVGGATMHATYEGKLVANQRFIDGGTANGAFKILQFKNSDVVFTNSYSDTNLFFVNTDSLKLHVVSGAWRKRRQPMDITGYAMTQMQIQSVLQIATSNRSRSGVLFDIA